MTGMGTTARRPSAAKAATQSAGKAAAESVTTAVLTTAGSASSERGPGSAGCRRRDSRSLSHIQAGGSRSGTQPPTKVTGRRPNAGGPKVPYSFLGGEDATAIHGALNIFGRECEFAEFVLADVRRYFQPVADLPLDLDNGGDGVLDEQGVVVLRPAGIGHGGRVTQGVPEILCRVRGEKAQDNSNGLDGLTYGGVCSPCSGVDGLSRRVDQLHEACHHDVELVVVQQLS